MDDLQRAVSDAFGSATVSVVSTDGIFDLQLHQPGMLRALRAAELSDGTLRFLLWAAALLSPQPPSLMVLNEPETSLHPDLLAPLAMLIRSAARDTQVVVVTHSAPLVSHLDAVRLELVKEDGETRVVGRVCSTLRRGTAVRDDWRVIWQCHAAPRGYAQQPRWSRRLGGT